MGKAVFVFVFVALSVVGAVVFFSEATIIAVWSGKSVDSNTEVKMRKPPKSKSTDANNNVCEKLGKRLCFVMADTRFGDNERKMTNVSFYYEFFFVRFVI